MKKLAAKLWAVLMLMLVSMQTKIDITDYDWIKNFEL